MDDNTDAADSLSMLLALQGHQTRVAYSAKDALVSATEFDPDVGLLDIGLPGMDGYELARQLRAKAQGKALRLVALTGYGQPEDHQRVMSAGFDAHLVKPVVLTAFESVLEGPAREGPGHGDFHG